MFLTNSTSKMLRITVLKPISMDENIEIFAVVLRPGSGLKLNGKKDYIINEESEFHEEEK